MRIRPTAGGLAFAVGLAILGGVGLFTGYRELSVMVLAGAVLIVVAALLPRVASPIEIERRLTQTLVQRGDNLDARLVVSAERRTGVVHLVDQVGEHLVPITVPSLADGETRDLRYSVLCETRGLHNVGPVLEERRDPFELMVRSSTHEVRHEIMVYPVLHDLRVVDPTAFIRQKSTPYSALSDDPMADFRTLRQYVEGDDPRLIHWPSVARSGELVVRDFLELRRTIRIVVLETNDTVLTDPEFEEAVEIAASLSNQSFRSGLVTISRTTDPASSGKVKPVTAGDQLLELYSLVKRTPAKQTIEAARVIPRGLSPDHVFLVTGGRSKLLADLLWRGTTRPKLAVVRVSDQPSKLPRLPVPTMDVRSALEFVMRWRRGIAA